MIVRPPPSVEELEGSKLSDGNHGFYNGVILTESALFVPPDTYGFTSVEWEVLHDYERRFDVREAVLSGSPVGVPARGVDYGMTDVSGGSGSTGRWALPSGTEFFRYVNTANDLEITDFAFTALARTAIAGPEVTPLLVDAADPSRLLISHLTYDDGREVLLSTVSNAWFLVHSQVIAYEFLDFATKGLYLGARRVYLNTHIDDLFLESAVWDVGSNTDRLLAPRRTSPDDIETVLSAQRAFNERHRTLEDFKVEFAFNAAGAGPVPRQDFPIAADATVAEGLPHRRHGGAGVLRVGPTGAGQRHLLARFDTSSSGQAPVELAGLRLVGADQLRPTIGRVCGLAQVWSEEEVTWSHASAEAEWIGRNGPEVDEATCRQFTVGGGVDIVDVTSLVRAWQSGEPNHGVAITMDAPYSTAAREAGVGLALALGLQRPLVDPLTDALVGAGEALLFLNHTFSHRDLDASMGADEEDVHEEISENLNWWVDLGLPQFSENRRVLVTGEHSGLADDNGTEADTSDDVAFPAGSNAGLFAAVDGLDVDFLASDASRPNQGRALRIEEHNAIILPRYPTGAFFNTRTPEELTDEYNWLFRERFVDEGLNPCEVPGAICTQGNYGSILAAEAELGLRHMLTFRHLPHYFHINNVVNYDGAGSTLLFDWLEAVVTAYEELFVLPVHSPPFHQIGRLTAQRLDRQEATVQAVLDVASGEVTLSADADVVVEITGVVGGALYGTKLIADVAVGLDEPKTVVVAAAVTAFASIDSGTMLDAGRPAENHPDRARISVGEGRVVLLQPDLDLLDIEPGGTTLRLPGFRVSGSTAPVELEVCAVTEAWRPLQTSWLHRSEGVSWTRGPGPTVDERSCIRGLAASGSLTSIDVSAIAQGWFAGVANNGVVVRTRGTGLVSFTSPAGHNGPDLLVS